MDMKNKLFWVFALNSSIYFLQGIGGIASTPLFYYLKEVLHYSPSMLMFIGAFTSLAWILKPIIGMTIDGTRLQRRTWILLAIFIDILFASLIGLFILPISLLVTVLMFSNWNTAWRDVAVDGIMVVEGKKTQITGKIQSVQWIAITISGMIATLIGAYIAEKNYPYQWGFLLLIPFYFIGIGCALKYKEEKKKGNCIECEGIQYCNYPIQNCVNIKQKLNYKQLFTNKKFLLVCLFILLYKYSPSFGTPLWYIERDNFHWSKMFIGLVGIIASVCSIIGAGIYYKFSKKINIKKWIIISVILGAFTSLAYLYFTPFTDILYNVLFSVVGMFLFLMIMDFMAQNCIEGLESTSFAMLCAVSNLAGTLSALSGGILLPLIGLKGLIILSSITSFLCLPLIPLIFKEVINEKI
jgi:MFS family permease